MKYIAVVAVLLLVIWGVASLGGGSESGPIKIGFIAPLTGDAATYGEPMRNYAAIAVEEINAAGGVDGRMIEMIYEDGMCSGKDGASAMQKLAGVDKVEVVLGGFCSSESLAAVPVAEQAKAFLVSGGSSSPDLTNISPLFARTYTSDATQGRVMAETSSQNGWEKVAFVQEQLDYPLGIYNAFNTAFVALGGTTVKEEFPTEATDFRTMLTKLRDAKPDALFIDTQTSASAERVLKQLTEMKWKLPLMLSDAASGDAEFITRNKAALEGALAGEVVAADNSRAAALKAAYESAYAAEVPYFNYGQTVYDAVYMIRDAIAEVGYDGEKVAAWFRSVRDWEGASGIVNIGDDGDRDAGHVARVVRNGQVVNLGQ